MNINKILKTYGFRVSDSGGGCEWYTKPVAYEGRAAFAAITDVDGCRLPQSLDDRVLVGIYDLNTGDELKQAVAVDPLRDYLARLDGSPGKPGGNAQ